MAEYLAAQEAGDEESEAEFAPGDDDDSDDDDEAPFDADNDDEDYTTLQGTISRHDGRLIYKGHILTETFELKSKEPSVYWAVHHPTKTSADEANPSRMRTIEMEGIMGKDNVTVDLTLTSQRNETGKSEAVGKKGHDEEEDGKKPAASPSKQASNSLYSVFGKGRDSSGAFEFYGQLDPSTAEHHTMKLECQKKSVSAAPAAAAAAAAPPPADDDDEDDADEGMGYDELIALHEDAGMSVEDLRKRYQSGGAADSNDDEDADDAKPAAKRPRPQEESDDGDDEEYGF